MAFFPKNPWCNEADLEKLVKLQQRKIKELKEDLRRCNVDTSYDEDDDDDYDDDHDEYYLDDSYERRRRRSMRTKRVKLTTTRKYDDYTTHAVSKKVVFVLRDKLHRVIPPKQYIKDNQQKLKDFVEIFLRNFKKLGYAKNNYFSVRITSDGLEVFVEMKREHFANVNAELKKYLAKYYLPSPYRTYHLVAEV